MIRARQVKKRLHAVATIRTVTRTMEMIAVWQFRKVHDRAASARAVVRRLGEVLADLAASTEAAEHPLLRPGAGGAHVLVALTSDRGLCGAYNNQVLDAAGAALAELTRSGAQVRLVMIGRRGMALLRYRSLPAPASALPQFPASELTDRAARFCADLVGQFLSGQVASVRVAYQRQLSAGTFRPEVHTFLPLALPPPAAAGPAHEYLPSPAGVLDRVLPLAARLVLLGSFLDAAVTEQIARMVAMRAATRNADDMIHLLTRQLNRQRQTRITMELAEIMGGAEALRK